MRISDISLPEIYRESGDFRFFCRWFEEALSKTQYDTENFFDLYDPLRCPAELIWALADTMGFKYDERLPVAFNRLVLLYFMSMIYLRGSKDGVTLAAETNLAQFTILMRAQGYTDDNGTKIDGKEIYYDRLEDTSIPVNSVYVTPHTEHGYIDVVYFSTKVPIDACIEYVRPLGMYLFQHSGVRFDARSKISVDARLTNSNDVGMSFGPTHVGHYRREDYARLQKHSDGMVEDTSHTRSSVWYKNSTYEDVINGNGGYGSGTNTDVNNGLRSIYSLQLSNNEEIVRALIDPIFTLGFKPQSVTDTVNAPIIDPMYQYGVHEEPSYLRNPQLEEPSWNLRYDKELDETITINIGSGHYDVETIDKSIDILNPAPAVNPVMMKLGDSISISDDNSVYFENK